MKSKTTAIILALFFGGLGIHQFYLGRGDKGIWYLLFFRTCIPSIIAIFDIAGIMGISEREREKKYNK